MSSTLSSVWNRKGSNDKDSVKHQKLEMTDKDVEKGSNTQSSSSSSSEKKVDGSSSKSAEPEKKKKKLHLYELMLILRPFFWPNHGSDGALLNRIRAISTWAFVGASKVASLYSPFFISSATNQLIAKEWEAAANSMIAFVCLRFAASVFKESQSAIYVRVRQQAAIELSELTFTHLHSLSLNWHLNKKVGGVIKSIDRGIDAANNLITYLFLYLVPALAECLAVVLLFFGQYRQWGLGVLIFGGVSLYIVVTIGITQWRTKVRAVVNKSDNDFHDKMNDSFTNYETVKYFTAEKYEIDRYLSSVIKYQKATATTNYSLNVLNASQQFLLSATLLGSILIAGKAVVSGDMSLGDWVAVQSWVAQIFIPLNFLGSIYGMIVQSIVDIENLSEILAEKGDIQDLPGAKDIPSSAEPKIEFKNVSFHYPSQPEENGLKKVNLTIPPGTTTAIVGHTGAGKTTISRLLFRFYDALDGMVTIGGYDIKKATQKSLRGLIGIVPQDTVLFNDTIRYNIRYGRQEATDEEVEKAAAEAQILDFILSLPDKWDTTVGERGLKLSGGIHYHYSHYYHHCYHHHDYLIIR